MAKRLSTVSNLGNAGMRIAVLYFSTICPSQTIRARSHTVTPTLFIDGKIDRVWSHNRWCFGSCAVHKVLVSPCVASSRSVVSFSSRLVSSRLSRSALAFHLRVARCGKVYASRNRKPLTYPQLRIPTSPRAPAGSRQGRKEHLTGPQQGRQAATVLHNATRPDHVFSCLLSTSQLSDCRSHRALYDDYDLTCHATITSPD